MGFVSLGWRFQTQHPQSIAPLPGEWLCIGNSTQYWCRSSIWLHADGLGIGCSSKQILRQSAADIQTVLGVNRWGFTWGFTASCLTSMSLILCVINHRCVLLKMCPVCVSQKRDWLALVAVHSDCWLLAVAFYNGARLNKEGR